jgi:hypothetical protein
VSGVTSAKRSDSGPGQPAIGLKRASSGAAAAMVMAAFVLVSLLFSVVTFAQTTGQPHAFTRSWENPNRTSLDAVGRLERSGITTGYADYWVAYKLDFLSQNRLTITPIGRDVIRSASIEDEVLASKHPAWLFVPPYEADRDASQFSAPALTIGPDGVAQAAFLGTLHRLGVPYRIVRTGLLNAVVPDRLVSPIQANMPAAPT